APHGSGKTTFLQQCATAFRAKGLRVGGVLAPSGGENGRRQLVLLQSSPQEPLALQLNDGRPGDGGGSGSPSEPTGETVPEGAIQVGNFIFDESVFAKARAELRGLAGDERGSGPAPCDWVLVDEIGPLELNRGQGLEPAVGELLRAGARGELGPPQSRFLIIVRPSLRDTVVQTYGLDGTGCAAADDDGEGCLVADTIDGNR
ncbi:unnamed protein product, partial [Polarella glacialis]